MIYIFIKINELFLFIQSAGSKYNYSINFLYCFTTTDLLTFKVGVYSPPTILNSLGINAHFRTCYALLMALLLETWIPSSMAFLIILSLWASVINVALEPIYSKYTFASGDTFVGSSGCCFKANKTTTYFLLSLILKKYNYSFKVIRNNHSVSI